MLMELLITEPCSLGPHKRSFTGESGQIREKYTALCPVPVILSRLLSNDSLSTTPTSPLARGQTKPASKRARTQEIAILRRTFPVTSPVAKSPPAINAILRTTKPRLSNYCIAGRILELLKFLHLVLDATRSARGWMASRSML